MHCNWCRSEFVDDKYHKGNCGQCGAAKPPPQRTIVRETGFSDMILGDNAGDYVSSHRRSVHPSLNWKVDAQARRMMQEQMTGLYDRSWPDTPKPPKKNTVWNIWKNRRSE